MMQYGFELSEQLRLPVLMRVVTRLAHSRADVEGGHSVAQNGLNPDNERTHWVLLPGNARRQYATLVEKQTQLLASSEESAYNKSEIINHNSEIKTWKSDLITRASWPRLMDPTSAIDRH